MPVNERAHSCDDVRDAAGKAVHITDSVALIVWLADSARAVYAADYPSSPRIL